MARTLVNATIIARSNVTVRRTVTKFAVNSILDPIEILPSANTIQQQNGSYIFQQNGQPINK